MTQLSRLDLEANKELDLAEKARVKTARSRAEKWLPWNTALVGLIATVTIVKGADEFSKLETWAQLTTGSLIVLGLALLGAGLFRFYSAAFGDPFNRELIERQPIETLHVRLIDHRRRADENAHDDLRTGIGLTIVGVLFVVIATGISWFGIADGSGTKATCVFEDGAVIVGVTGSSIDVKELAEGFTIGACPS